MGYVALRPLKVLTDRKDAKGKPVYETRPPGAPVPEAASWANLDVWIKRKFVGIQGEAPSPLGFHTPPKSGNRAATAEEIAEHKARREAALAGVEIPKKGAVEELSEAVGTVADQIPEPDPNAIPGTVFPTAGVDAVIGSTGAALDDAETMAAATLGEVLPVNPPAGAPAAPAEGEGGEGEAPATPPAADAAPLSPADELMKMSKAELVQAAEAVGIKKTWAHTTKAEIVAALLEAVGTQQAQSSPESTPAG